MRGVPSTPTHISLRSKLRVSVGTPVAQCLPQDPHVQFSCMQLFPRMLGVEAQIGIWMKDFGQWEPLLNKTIQVLP